jgi:uncharacterized protein (DUF1330 family)
MAGYWMVRADILDSEKQAAYARLATAAVAKFGGRYLARGGQAESREGSSRERLVIIEFPSYAEARAAYDSPDYQQALAVLEGGVTRDFAIVEGLDETAPSQP